MEALASDKELVHSANTMIHTIIKPVGLASKEIDCLAQGHSYEVPSALEKKVLSDYLL